MFGRKSSRRNVTSQPKQQDDDYYSQQQQQQQQQSDYREINQDVNNDDVLRKPRNWSGSRRRRR